MSGTSGALFKLISGGDGEKAQAFKRAVFDPGSNLATREVSRLRLNGLLEGTGQAGCVDFLNGCN